MHLSIPVNKKRIPTALLLYTAITVFFVPLTLDGSLGGWVYQVLFGISLAALILRVLMLLVDYGKTLFDRQARMDFTEEGIDDRRSIFSCGMIPWTTVVNLQLRKGKRTMVLLVMVDNPERLLKAQPWWRRLFLRPQAKMFGTPVVITQTWLSANLREVWDQVQPYLEARSKAVGFL
jgi:hypothetical protein